MATRLTKSRATVFTPLRRSSDGVFCQVWAAMLTLQGGCTVRLVRVAVNSRFCRQREIQPEQCGASLGGALTVLAPHSRTGDMLAIANIKAILSREDV